MVLRVFFSIDRIPHRGRGGNGGFDVEGVESTAANLGPELNRQFRSLKQTAYV